jgi:uncharacterized protein (TIGR03437 family)
MKLLPVVLALLVPLLRAAETGACAAQTGGGSVQTMNSWVVQNDQVVENQTIRLNGTLDLQRGTLTLRNVNLEINASQPFNYSPRGGVLAVNGPGGQLVLSGSRISSASSGPGVINVAGAAIDHSCFLHTSLLLAQAGASSIQSSEFVLSAGDRTDAIDVVGGAGADIENNLVRAAISPQAPPGSMGQGISLTDTHDSSLLGNTVLGFGQGFALTRAWKNHVAGNTWQGPVLLSGVDQLTSRWWSVAEFGWASEGGMGLEQWSNNNLIENNTLIGAQSATLLIHQSAYNTISHNTILGAGYGVALRWASNNLIDGNDLTDLYDNAIHAHKSHDNTITNNHIYNAGGGVALYASQNNVIQGNTLAETDSGIFIHESAKNTVDGNTLSGGIYGVYVVSNSSGNAVTNNNIVANDSPAWDDGTGNSWKANFWGMAAEAPQAIPPANASDAAPANTMLAPAAAPVKPLSPPAFNGPLKTLIDLTDQEVWQDARTINAAITIENGGSLTLKGATLTYVVPQPTSTIWIQVMAGGTLDIENSKLIGADWDHALAIKVYKGGHFTMKNSQMQNAGTWVGSFSAAISVEGDDADIENNTFTNVYCALSGEDGPIQNTRFINNTIVGTVKGIAPNTATVGAVYSGNHVSRYGEWGAEFGRPGAANSQVQDNVFSDGWGPAIVASSLPEDYGYARNSVSGIAGPDMLAEANGGVDFRQAQTASRTISPVQTGGGIETEVTLANIGHSFQFFTPEWTVFTATLTADGQAVTSHNIKVPFGQFARIRLSGAAPATGPYGISLSPPSTGPAPFGVSKAAMRFAAAPGSQAAPQVLAVANTPTNPGAWVWNAATDTPWLHVTPTAGEGAGEMMVTADASGLAAGTYTGKIQITIPGQDVEVVNVSLRVTSDVPVASAKPASLSLSAAQSAPAAQKVALSLTAPNLALPISVSTRTERGYNWLSATADSKTLPATVTVSVDPSALSGGQYTGEVLVSIAGAAQSPLEIPVTLTAPFSGGAAASIGAVVNGASHLAGFAAGSWVTIQGTNLSRTTRTWGTADFVQGTMPASLDGVSVSIDNKPAYVAYVSPTQLNVLAPFAIDTPSDTAANIMVTAPDGTAQGWGLKREFAPGVFTFGGTNAAAVHTDGALVCAEGSLPGANCRSAKPGEVVALYLTGLGTGLNPPPPDGPVITAPVALRDTVGVTLGGTECAVSYAGLVSGGLYQVNLKVPGLPAGSYDLVARIGGVDSQSGVTMAVAP